MKKKALSRVLMIASGILAAIIIVFSQTYHNQTELAHKKDSEKKSKSEKVLISTPSDAVTSNTLVNLSENPSPPTQPSFLSSVTESIIKIESKVFVNFFRTLFRVIISPNAP